MYVDFKIAVRIEWITLTPHQHDRDTLSHTLTQLAVWIKKNTLFFNNLAFICERYALSWETERLAISSFASELKGYSSWPIIMQVPCRKEGVFSGNLQAEETKWRPWVDYKWFRNTATATVNMSPIPSYTALQSQKAAYAYLQSKQILPVGFARQYTCLCVYLHWHKHRHKT